ncbi:DUF1630-domain-containing protein [Trichodelitschia bisporula]|uniref:DUF1630-domain-containing protein n=1 Tax=Trichodelitschia bisporula TaxID=703511 RepID=A0A6G1I2H3_9PEZI|nr:DUF1630-domain-containing protein [Trichodelitschia bisporula]
MEKLKQLLHPGRSLALEEWPSFRQWAVCFIVCNFNVDVGPEIELIYPPEVSFTASDLSAICFNSFPERHDTDIEGDVFFQFTVRNNSPDVPLLSPAPPHGSADAFYGNCIFRQEYDSMTKRSFNQRSLVLISTHEFPSFFAKLLRIVTDCGPISDPTRLEAACSQISEWPAPFVGHLELPFLGSLLKLEIPPHPSFPLQGLWTSLPRSDLIFAYEPMTCWDTVLPYIPSLAELYVVYEKLLLGESVIVLAKSPHICADFVSILNDLIRPVPYAGVRRPYLTMQSDFFIGSHDRATPRHFLIGITNPFLLKRLMTAAETVNNSSAPSPSISSDTPHILYLKTTPGPPSVKPYSAHHRRKHTTEFDIPGGLEPQGPTKRFLKSDHAFTAALDNALRVERENPTGPPLASPLIRRHFAELTAQILAPINRYLTTHMKASSSAVPVQGSSFAGPSHYANFSQATFLQSLAKHGAAVKFRGQNPLQRYKARDAFYERFCQSHNFFAWLEMKVTLEREASAGMLGGPGTGPVA